MAPGSATAEAVVRVPSWGWSSRARTNKRESSSGWSQRRQGPRSSAPSGPLDSKTLDISIMHFVCVWHLIGAVIPPCPYLGRKYAPLVVHIHSTSRHREASAAQGALIHLQSYINIAR